MIVAVTGIVVLVGWMTDVRTLTSLHPSWASMKANTAMCFVLLGAALWMSVRRTYPLALARWCGAAALTIAALTISQDIGGWHLGLDELVFADAASPDRPGRMAVNTALLLIALSVAVMTLDAAALSGLTAQVLGLLTSGVAGVALCGYVYGAQELYAIPGFGSLSIYTAACCLLLGLGLVAAQPRRGVMAVISADTPGGQMTRRVFPIIGIAPIALGIVSRIGERNGLFGAPFGLALFTVASIVILGTMVGFAARRLIESEARHRQTSTDLADQRQRLAATLASLGDAVVACDRQGRVTLMNPAAERSIGWRLDEIAGRPIDDICRIVDERDGGSVVSLSRRVMHERTNAALPAYAALRTRAGATMTIEGSATPILGNNGACDGAVLVFRDITRERHAEQALAKSQALLQGISDNSSTVIYVKDLDGRYLLVNRRFAEIFERPADQCLDKTDYDLFAPRDAERFRGMDLRVASIGTALTEEEQVPLADGTHTFISVKCPLRDAAGRVYAVFGISTDITDRKRAEATLRASEERTRAIIDAALDAVVTMDASGTITGWNPQAEKTFGWTRPEAIGRTLADTIIPLRYREAHRRGLQRFLATGEGPALNRRLELSGLHRDGREMSIELSIATVAASDAISFSAFLRDITERKRIEAALVESRQHYQALAESLPHLVWTCRADGYCDYLSRQWVDYTGRPAEEQLGSGWANQLHPDDRNRVQAEWEQATARGDRFDIEFRIRRADGVYRWFRTRAVPLQDSAGRVVKWFGSNTDFDDYKRSQSRLHAQLERLNLLDRLTRAIGERQDLQSILQVVIASLEDQLPLDFCAIALYDRSDETLVLARIGVNSEALAATMGLSQNARVPIDSNGLARCVQGHLVHEPDIERVASPFPQRLARAGLRSLVVAPLVVESSVFGILIAGRRESPGFSSAECEFLRQLSEHVALAVHQAELYEALQRAYDDLRLTQQTVMQQERLKALGQMASGIAHDINNAISPVALYTETLIESEQGLSHQARDYLATIQRAIEDVAQTVARMREFYREREPQLTLAPVDVNRVVRDVVQLTRARWSDMPQQRGVVIHAVTELDPSDPLVPGVESEIREALINLVFNAVDAMPEGGRVMLRSRTEAAAGSGGRHPSRPTVDIEITDTGLGMDAETRRRCLEPFFTTKGERGTGLGLAMVYGMIQRHSADLAIESAQGQGTTIRLSFAASSHADVATSSHRDVARPRRLRILVVDDDPLLLKTLRDVLEADGHVVTTAAGGQAGIDLFQAAHGQEGAFAVVITDLGMPYVDGRQVAARIKSAAATTPVILLTGWGQRLLDEGDFPPFVDRVMSKPPRLADLRLALSELTAEFESDDPS
jgi:PAS domain S-box-containing protein